MGCIANFFTYDILSETKTISREYLPKTIYGGRYGFKEED
jgi:hypothetical protein